MARHARRWPRRRQRGLAAFVQGHRWSLATGLSAVAVAAACQMPYDYDRGFGATLWCEGDEPAQFDTAVVHGLADRLHSRAQAEQVAIRVMADGETPAVLRIDLWGEHATAAGEDLLAEVEAEPSLKSAHCRVEPHVETVHGTLGGRLGLELFDLELLDVDDADAARAEILERLEARGLRGDAEVEISDHGDGRREVKIRIEAESTGP